MWRIASAEVAFADFDSLTVEVDRLTLSPDDKKRLLELVEHRPSVLPFLEHAIR